ncbi:carbamoyl phosphate synthetase [Emiliania huxleyi CCMP1516]|uniref:Uncharacterized protein n=3 Tax=Eukaryota TaxID=2759 RepID=A0A0D3JC11_EMIH1|nr:carbamoyl phosphate synthetase [Emiliania huxleyi CCMP1516]EOD21046.1 carbamoyl phosphate synthetase [Emiliania huxleyi CCMP1516]|eukprot:XP_005773475.1 carbamoyl phosphate synthetase [Emiliania huxleyi CCMP1516]
MATRPPPSRGKGDATPLSPSSRNSLLPGTPGSNQSLSSPVLHGNKLGCKRPSFDGGSPQMLPPRKVLAAKRAKTDITSELEQQRATLILADGTRWEGVAFGAKVGVAGEVVFNTAMVGYPESLTDPSYRGQLLCLTYPMIGNYGVPDLDSRDDIGLPTFFESEKIHATALIVAEYSHDACHWNLTHTLSDWLKQHNVPGIYGIDTRALTKHIREQGAMLGKIVPAGAAESSVPQVNPNDLNLVAEVSLKEPRLFVSHAPPRQGKDGKRMRILAIDCGIKANIIRYFMSKGVELLLVPWDYDFSGEAFDGLFISNGPGDPTQCQKTIGYLRALIERADAPPVFGICLGNQLLALAAGCTTFKMKYGNRGANQPCIDTRTGRCYITAQNHGFAVDPASIPQGWEQFFVNANDATNEGIIHKTRPFFSVQFHPEACAGPTDTDFLFEMFLRRVHGEHAEVTVSYRQPTIPARKVLLLGSGGLSIGQAGEFDYSGSQAIKALKEMRCEVVLINPNIATVQTSEGMADRVYFLPVTPDVVRSVIERRPPLSPPAGHPLPPPPRPSPSPLSPAARLRVTNFTWERPDGILLQFGGQTALNCGVALDKNGVLAEFGVRVLGTPVEAIIATEDREIFNAKLTEINERIAEGYPASTVDDAVAMAAKIGFPSLPIGGLGSGFAHDEESARALATQALINSPQVLVERSMKGWKEIEYEVVRDCNDNCITTLSNAEYMKLRSVAIKVARHLGIVGECNIQYALNPQSEEYCIIEVNARLSRSSALASKATGYPLAYVAARLAMGENLPSVRNSVTKTTTACFEPSMDYCVVKFPRWDLNKFKGVSAGLGSAMKSVGEVMSIGRNFQEAMQKAIRMAAPGMLGFQPLTTFESDEAINAVLSNATDQRVDALAAAFERGDSVASIEAATKINPWFLCKLHTIHLLRKHLQKRTLQTITAEEMLLAKQQGFSDKQIAIALGGADDVAVRRHRKELGVLPVVKQIDTLAAEFPAQTNYLYMTYNGTMSDQPVRKSGVFRLNHEAPSTMVLGCGAYRIGSSVEFDWCAVSCIRTLRKLGHRAIMVNFNPETVSTDYDECDELYFEEISTERVMDIYEHEAAFGVIVSVGGQTPNNLALPLEAAGANILGTKPSDIDKAEDRNKFSSILDQIGVDQPDWREMSSIADAKAFCNSAGYPCLIRPSYVLSGAADEGRLLGTNLLGAAMKVVFSDSDLERFLAVACEACVSPDHPVVISKFIEGAKEIEVDAVACEGTVLNYAIAEHVENAGVHSGDATLVLPAQKLFVETVRRVKRISRQIASELKISGPFNLQLLAKDNEVKVIEANVRASRTFPFSSKTLKAGSHPSRGQGGGERRSYRLWVMVGSNPPAMRISLLDNEYVGIKAPMFSFTRLVGAPPHPAVAAAAVAAAAAAARRESCADPVLGVEMASTGEVATFGEDAYDAILTSMISTGFRIPQRSVFLCLGPLEAKMAFLPEARCLISMGLRVSCSQGTYDFYKSRGLDVHLMHKPLSKTQPNIEDAIKSGEMDLVINVRDSKADDDSKTDGFLIRRAAVDSSVCLLTDIKLATLITEAIHRRKPINIKAWDEFGS